MKPILKQENEFKEIFAKNLRYLRFSQKPYLSQERLANLLNIDPRSLSAYENGRTMPPYFVIQGISDYFHVPIEQLTCGSLVKERKVKQ